MARRPVSRLPVGGLRFGFPRARQCWTRHASAAIQSGFGTVRMQCQGFNPCAPCSQIWQRHFLDFCISFWSEERIPLASCSLFVCMIWFHCSWFTHVRHGQEFLLLLVVKTIRELLFLICPYPNQEGIVNTSWFSVPKGIVVLKKGFPWFISDIMV
jgi:hypothetical protein